MYKNTAAGVAKIRFTELQAKNPIVEDKFSSPFVLGSSIIRITGHRLQYFGFEALVPGLFDGIVARTKIIDETVLKAVKDGATQYVILGAGYDTRGHRLDLPANVKVRKRERIDPLLPFPSPLQPPPPTPLLPSSHPARPPRFLRWTSQTFRPSR